MMEVRWTRQAVRDTKRFPETVRVRIRAKVDQYAADPASLAGQVKRLKGSPYFRLRVGDYRVIFDEDGTVLTVLRARHRSEACS